MIVYIYCLKDPESKEIRYIGKTVNIKRRLSQHIQHAKNSITHNSKWLNSLLKKKLKPIIEIIEECTKENWQKREIYWISFYKDKTNLCNHHDGGLGCLGRKLTKKEKERIRKIGLKQSYFNETEKKKIWKLISKNIDYNKILKEYPKLSKSSYVAIKNGGLWRHITNLPKAIRGDHKGSSNHKSRKVICTVTNKTWDSARLAWFELYKNDYKYSYFRCMLSGHNKNKTTLVYIDSI